MATFIATDIKENAFICWSWFSIGWVIHNSASSASSSYGSAIKLYRGHCNHDYFFSWNPCRKNARRYCWNCIRERVRDEEIQTQIYFLSWFCLKNLQKCETTSNKQTNEIILISIFFLSMLLYTLFHIKYDQSNVAHMHVPVLENDLHGEMANIKWMWSVGQCCCVLFFIIAHKSNAHLLSFRCILRNLFLFLHAENAEISVFSYIQLILYVFFFCSSNVILTKGIFLRLTVKIALFLSFSFALSDDSVGISISARLVPNVRNHFRTEEGTIRIDSMQYRKNDYFSTQTIYVGMVVFLFVGMLLAHMSVGWF